MALPDLIARLEREADDRLAALAADNQAQVDALSAAAQRVTRDAQDAELAKRRAVRGAELERQKAAARREVRTATLHGQHGLLARVFERACALAPELLQQERYVTVVTQHVKETLGYVQGLPTVVRFPPALRDAVVASLAGTPQVSLVEDASMPPGVKVSSVDGFVSMDNTLPARLERMKARLSVELLAEVRT